VIALAKLMNSANAGTPREKPRPKPARQERPMSEAAKKPKSTREKTILEQSDRMEERYGDTLIQDDQTHRKTKYSLRPRRNGITLKAKY
jgi:hypothetical protein